MVGTSSWYPSAMSTPTHRRHEAIPQALVAIGGNASRLKRHGVDVPISKSFLQVHSRPLLYWCLLSLHEAGVRRLVLSGNTSLQLRSAETLIVDLPAGFESVTYFQDPGLGVHGLPWHTRDHLESTFLFECGHSIMAPDHYVRLSAAKSLQNVVWSAFRPHRSNRRQPVTLKDGVVSIRRLSFLNRSAIAHPFALDGQYVARLPELGFNVDRIIAAYSQSAMLSYVKSAIPPEFDVPAEMTDVTQLYEEYIAQREWIENPTDLDRPVRDVPVVGGRL
jgi:hypothetical protein